MSFGIGSIVNGVANFVLPGVTDSGGAATDPALAHEPAHAQLAGTPNSNPAAGAERQGIIIIGGDSLHGGLHPAVAAGASVIGQTDPGAVAGAFHDFGKSLGGVGPAPDGGGFSGFLHTIANLGRG